MVALGSKMMRNASAWKTNPNALKNGDLTGYRRFRNIKVLSEVGSWIPALILQVEYNEWVNTVEGKPGRWVCMWRDATPDDVQEEVVV